MPTVRPEAPRHDRTAAPAVAVRPHPVRSPGCRARLPVLPVGARRRPEPRAGPGRLLDGRGGPGQDPGPRRTGSGTGPSARVEPGPGDLGRYRAAAAVQRFGGPGDARPDGRRPGSAL